MPSRNRFERAAPWVAAGLLLLTFALSYLGKAVCLDGETGFWAETRYCYSDVRVLWGLRGFDVDDVPYSELPEGYPRDYTLEYPPGMTFPAWMIAEVTSTREGFFNLHALTFAIAAGVILWASDRALRADDRKRNRWRLLGIALSPGLLLFGLQNWDLWAVALVAVGLAAARRDRAIAAAAWWGLAAAVKWWPAILVLTLVVGPWRSRDRHLIDLRPALVAAVAWLLVQVPALVIGPDRWWDAIKFHLTRSANRDSLVAAIERFGASLWPGTFWDTTFHTTVTVVSLSVLALASLFVLHQLHERRLRPANAALILVATFLLTGKVFSPQFVLWLLPLAAVATVSWWPMIAIELTNAATWLFYGPWLGGELGPDSLLLASQVSAVLRAAAVAWLIVAAARGNGDEPDPDQLSGVKNRVKRTKTSSSSSLT